MVGVVLAATVGIAGAQQASPTTGDSGPPLVPLDTAISPLAVSAAQVEAAQALAAQRNAPGQADARKASRTAYAGADAHSALELVRKRVAPVGSLAAYQPLVLPTGEKVERYASDNAAQVELPNGKKVILASALPLRAKTADGDLGPVDLSLEQSNSGFRPANGLVPVTLPASLGDGAQLDDDHLSFDFPDAKSVDGTQIDDSVAYPNSQTDSDTLIQPEPLGAEISWIIRSSAAPEKFEIRVTSTNDDPVTLAQAPDGQGIAVQRDGRDVAVVLPPTASDADGQSVATTMSVAGDGIELRVAHQNADVKYPIVLDPHVTDPRPWQSGGTSNFGGWVEGSNRVADYLFYPGDPGFLYGSGLYVGTKTSVAYNAGDYGEWVIQAPHQSYLSQVDLPITRHDAHSSVFLAGLFNTVAPIGFPSTSVSVNGGTRFSAAPYTTASGFTQQSINICASSTCDDATGTAGNEAFIGLQQSSAGTTNPIALAYVGSATMYFGDRDIPSMSEHTAPIAPNPSAWTNGSSNFAFDQQLDDPGTGPASLEIDYDRDVPDKKKVLQQPIYNFCFGAVCPTSIHATLGPVTAVDVPATNSFAIPQGIGEVDTVGYDWALQASNELRYPIKLDSIKPKIDPYGTLTTADGGVLAPSTNYTLNPNVTDTGANGVAASGVASLKIGVDSNPTSILNDTSGCGTINCARNPQITFSTSGLSAGPHTITFTATDAAGNTNTRTINVTVAGVGTMISPGPTPLLSPLSSTIAVQSTSAIPLRARVPAGSTATGVTFESSPDGSTSWTAITGAVLTQETGSCLCAAQAPISNQVTPALSWDTHLLSFSGGVVWVRANFMNGSASLGTSDPVKVQVTATPDAGEQYANAPIGPGTVALASGDFSITSNDVSVDAVGNDLTVGRTYHSRDPNASSSGPLGPGWTLSTPVVSANESYTSLQEGSGGAAVVVKRADGTQVGFISLDGLATFIPQPGSEQLELTAGSTTGSPPLPSSYTLDDGDGVVTKFVLANSQYQLDSVKTSATNGTTEWVYGAGAADDPLRPGLEIAPEAATSSCTAATYLGCRTLSFGYAPSTTNTTGLSGPSCTSGCTFGAYPGRLTEVDLTAADPSTMTQTSDPVADYEYDSSGQLRGEWDPRISPNLITTYAYNTNNVLSDVTPPGELPWHLDFATALGDPNVGRLSDIKRSNLASGTATWSVSYGVPLSGGSEPNHLSSSDLAKWGQKDLPVTGTAIFPPTEPPPTSDYNQATIHYLDGNNQEVDTALPGGNMSVTEHDLHHNIVRELSAHNRAVALAQTGGTSAQAAYAALEDTQNTYNFDGTELLTELGPQHTVVLDDNTTATARNHTVYQYDEGAPPDASGAAGFFRLVTTQTESAELTNGTDTNSRATATSYTGQNGLGWTLRQPTQTIQDPGGLNLASTTRYDPTTGAVTAQSQPSDTGGTGAGTTTTTLYTDPPNSTDPACGNNHFWAGLPCRVQPAAQNASSKLPTTQYTYNRLYQVATKTDTRTDTSGTNTRTATYGYETNSSGDQTGRLHTKAISVSSGTPGAATPTMAYGYSTSTGRQTTVSSASPNVGTITRAYDQLGRLSSYTDANGQATTYGYDTLDRVNSVADGKGTHTTAYDLDDDVSSVSDTQMTGSITGSYDEDGNLLVENYPDGLSGDYTRDETGQTTALNYVKTLGCSTSCTWLQLATSWSTHDQARFDVTPMSFSVDAYDGAGRLALVDDIGTAGCTVRKYNYDADSNRLSAQTIPALSGGGCNPTGTGSTASHTYDAADRLTDSGTTYDPWGNTTALPNNATLSHPLTAGYYTNNQIQTLTQSGTTLTYTDDPVDRVESRSSAAGTITNHYSDDTDNPSWTQTSSAGAYTRQIEGVDGNLAATYDSTAATPLLFQLADPHGDISATAGPSTSITGLTSTADSDEFGVPRTSTPSRYSWLGAKERSTESAAGTELMGARVYEAATGRFLQTDPVPGGSANSYDYANQDPQDQVDPNGDCAFDAYFAPSYFVIAGIAHWEVCYAGYRVGYLHVRVPRGRSHSSLFERAWKLVDSHAFQYWGQRAYNFISGCATIAPYAAYAGTVYPIIGTGFGAAAGCIAGGTLFEFTPTQPYGH